MRAYLNIYGLPLEMVADNALLFQTLLEDLRPFQIAMERRRPGLVRLTVGTLPRRLNGRGVPSSFDSYAEMATQEAVGNRTVSRYGRSAITVITHLRERHIETAIAMDTALLPDPAMHWLFTQPVSPWLKQRGLFFLHAACVAQGGDGVLLLGPSRAGKSILSVSAVRGGFRFLSDEQPLLVRRGGRVRVYGFPRRIRLDRSAARLFPELQGQLRIQRKERIAFHIQEIWPHRSLRSCRPRLLLFPHFNGGPLRIRPLSQTEAIARLLQDDHFVWYRNGPWKSLSRQHLSLFRRLVGETSAYTLAYSNRDLPSIPALLRSLLTRSA